MNFRPCILMLSAALLVTACQDDARQGQGAVVTGGQPTVLSFTNGFLESVNVELTKTPGGFIEVGKGFSVSIRVFHKTERPGVSEIFGTNAWGLRYGQLFQVMGANNAVTPTFVNDTPWVASVATGSAWQGTVNFLCRNPGMTMIRYRGQVTWPVPPGGEYQGTGIDHTVSGDLNAQCIATGSGGGGTNVAPTPQATRVGPAMDYPGTSEPYGSFAARMWRSPAGDDVPAGQTVQVHVEVENRLIRSTGPITASTPGWALAGRLYQSFGDALTPRRYTDAPAYRENVAALGTWSHDYSFTCQKTGVAQLRYDANLYGDLGQPSSTSTISVDGDSLRCINVEKVKDEKGR